MLNRQSKKTGRVPAWIPVLCYLALAVAALALFHSYTVTDEEELFLTPTFADAGGWDIYRLDDAGGRVALTPKEAAETTGTVYLSRVLDPAYEESGYTTLELDGPVSVFLDGELLYTTAPGSGDRAERVELPAGYEVPAAGEVPRLTLPPGYGDKMLTLAFERDADSYGTPRVILSSRAVEIASTAATANRLGMPAAAYMTAALLLLGLFLYSGVQGNWDWPCLLYTSVFAVFHRADADTSHDAAEIFWGAAVSVLAGRRRLFGSVGDHFALKGAAGYGEFRVVAVAFADELPRDAADTLVAGDRTAAFAVRHLSLIHI